jgi:hypothetical protein
LKHRSENSPARGQILTVLQRQYRDIAQKTGEICAGPADLQPMLFKSDRLLDAMNRSHFTAHPTPKTVQSVASCMITDE